MPDGNQPSRYVPSDSDPPPRGLMRRLMALSNALGLDRQERLDLAGMLLSRDVTSYKQLVHYDAVRLVDAMVGFGLVSAVKDLRDPCKRCGQRESATGPGGDCRACEAAWKAWTPPPEVAEVIEDAIFENAVQTPDVLAGIILRRLHEENYRVDRH